MDEDQVIGAQIYLMDDDENALCYRGEGPVSGHRRRRCSRTQEIDKTIDMESFPLLRIDHIPHLTDDMLREAIKQLDKLIFINDRIDGTTAGGANGSVALTPYMKKQRRVMLREQARREHEKHGNNPIDLGNRKSPSVDSVDASSCYSSATSVSSSSNTSGDSSSSRSKRRTVENRTKHHHDLRSSYRRRTELSNRRTKLREGPSSSTEVLVPFVIEAPKERNIPMDTHSVAIALKKRNRDRERRKLLNARKRIDAEKSERAAALQERANRRKLHNIEMRRRKRTTRATHRRASGERDPICASSKVRVSSSSRTMSREHRRQRWRNEQQQSSETSVTASASEKPPTPPERNAPCADDAVEIEDPAPSRCEDVAKSLDRPFWLPPSTSAGDVPNPSSNDAMRCRRQVPASTAITMRVQARIRVSLAYHRWRYVHAIEIRRRRRIQARIRTSFAYYRWCHLRRVEYQRRRRVAAARSAQSLVRGWLSRRLTMRCERASIRIQAFVRGRVIATRRLRRVTRALETIQRFTRAFTILFEMRRRVFARNRAVLTAQSFYRACIFRRHCRRRSSAGATILRFVRKYVVLPDIDFSKEFPPFDFQKLLRQRTSEDDTRVKYRRRATKMEIPEWIKHLKSLQSALGSCSKMVMPETHRGSRHHRWYKVVQNRMELVSLLKASLQDASDGSSSWRETREGLFNFLWTWKRPKIRWDRLFPWQRVNHFRGVQVITKKDKLKETLHHYQGLSARFASAFALQPDTFVLPREYTAFVRSYSDYASMAGCKNLWILKPASMSRGRGIHLVKDLGDVSYASEAVIQKYVEKPLLLDGYKFDLRIYVLVTSFQPLEAFIYRDGFARFALDKFCVKESSETKSSRANINNLRMHLTNSSVQHARLDLEEALLRATPFQRAPASEIGGSKMTLSELWRQLRSAGHDVEKIQSAIDDCIVRSLLCADDHIAYQPCAFEVFGYDILVDANLRPWLVEVNASPSMGCLNDLDRRLKGALIRDTVALVDPTPFDAVVLRRVVDAALAYAGGSRRQATKMLFGAAMSTHSSASFSASRRWNRMLNRLFRGSTRRRYGDRPSALGRYRRLCPGSNAFNSAVRMKETAIRSITGSYLAKIVGIA